MFIEQLSKALINIHSFIISFESLKLPFLLHSQSNCLYLQIIMIDEPNGNDVINPRRSTTAATASSSTNSHVAAVATASIPTSYSNDDLSLSLSEYTDADESMSAPTEFLAEVQTFYCNIPSSFSFLFSFHLSLVIAIVGCR